MKLLSIILLSMLLTIVVLQPIYSQENNENDVAYYKYYRYIADYNIAENLSKLKTLTQLNKEQALKADTKEKFFFKLHYTKENRIVKLEYFYSENKLNESRDYDAMGFLTQAEKYDVNGKLLRKEYFKQGILQVAETYKDGKEVEASTRYSYTSDNKISKMENYKEGRIVDYTTQAYDTDGRLSLREHFEGGKKVWIEKIEYDPKGKGNLPILIQHIENNMLSYKEVIKYDQTKVRSKISTSYNNGKVKQIITEDSTQKTKKVERFDDMEKLEYFVIVYYDEKGNVIRSIKNEGDGFIGTDIELGGGPSGTTGSLGQITGGGANEVSLDTLKRYFNFQYFTSIELDKRYGSISYKDSIDDKALSSFKGEAYYRVILTKQNIPLIIEKVKNNRIYEVYHLSTSNKPIKLEELSSSGKVNQLSYFDKNGRMILTEKYSNDSIMSYILYYYDSAGNVVRKEESKSGKFRDLNVGTTPTTETESNSE